LQRVVGVFFTKPPTIYWALLVALFHRLSESWQPWFGPVMDYRSNIFLIFSRAPTEIMKYKRSNLEFNLVPFGLWTLRNKPTQRQLVRR
jgi:hypothetical protein